jgi:hypothetical protein
MGQWEHLFIDGGQDFPSEAPGNERMWGDLVTEFLAGSATPCVRSSVRGPTGVSGETTPRGPDDSLHLLSSGAAHGIAWGLFTVAVLGGAAAGVVGARRRGWVRGLRAGLLGGLGLLLLTMVASMVITFFVHDL